MMNIVILKYMSAVPVLQDDLIINFARYVLEEYAGDDEEKPV